MPGDIQLMNMPDEHLAALRMLAVTEEELQRIILNIHDGPVQKLFAALSQVNLLEVRAGAGMVPSEQLITTLHRVSGLLESSLGEIKTSLGTFRPPEFARRDLLSVLEGLIVQHEAFTGCKVDFEAHGPFPRVSLPAKIALYRIVQEALSNAYRHAGVNTVALALSTGGHGVRMQVTDTGRGFVPPPLVGPEATEREEHIGLRGMRERVTLVGGRFSIASSPGHGTHIVVEVPTHG